MGDTPETLHKKLIKHISGDLHPSLKDRWSKFVFSVSYKVGKATLESCKSFNDVAGKLMEKSLIGVGDYDFLIDTFGTIELTRLQGEVKAKQNEIQDAIEKCRKEKETTKEKSTTVDPKRNKTSSELENKMVNHAAEVLHPLLPDNWSRFTKSYISHFIQEDEMKRCNSFEAFFNKLKEKNFIVTGNYEFLTGVLSSIDMIKLEKDVERFEMQINAALANECKDSEANNVPSAVTLPNSVRLHYEMKKYVDGAVSPLLENWSSFMTFIDLNDAEKKQCNSFSDAFNKLMGKYTIGLGRYNVLVQIFNDIQLIALKKKVEDYQKRIQEAMKQEETEKEQQMKGEMSDREWPQAKKKKPDSKDQVDAAAIRQEISRTSGSVPAYNPQQQNEQDKFGDQIEACIVKGNVKLEDIVGLQQMKKALYQAVILPQKHPQVFTGNLHPWKGILLFGPPGTGKSYLAKAAATDTKSTFFSISSADILSKWVGESGKMVKALFNKARERKPSIIFLDEVDGLCLSRHEHHAGANRQVITEFLKQMDGVGKEEMEGILVLGATNRPGDLDDAMLRRFQKRFYVTMPDAKARSELFKQHIGRPHSLRDDEFDVLGEQSEGYSGADIYNVGQDAMMIGVDKGQEAKYFVEISDQSRENPGKLDRFWTPCSPNTPGAKRMAFNDIPKNKFQRPKVTMEDVQKCLSQRKPSVNIESLKMFKEFDEKYGEQKRDGKAEETCREANVGAEEAACN